MNGKTLVTSPYTGSAELMQRLLSPDRLIERQLRADRLLASEGAGHLVHDLPVRADGRAATLTSRPWRVDPIPVVLDAAVFSWLQAAVEARLDGLEAVLADLYGRRSLLRERIIPADAVASTPSYRTNAVGSTPRRWLTTYAVDVAADENGDWWVVRDYTDAPAGIGYALLDRSVISRTIPEIMTAADVASTARFPVVLRRALTAASTSSSPRVVLFSGGLDHSSFVEHSYLAVQLGINLVEGADLVVRQSRIWLRTLSGLEPVDVLYRRLEDRFIDPLAVNAVGSVGVPGLLQSNWSGGVELANAHGSGVIESDEVSALLPAAFDRLAPDANSLQPLPGPMHPLARHPISSRHDFRDSAPVVLRLFAVHDGVRAHVMVGGTGRVLAAGDHPAHPTAATAKDVWVLGQSNLSLTGVKLPQVDFGRSVPTRAADSLYWLNRAAERSEAMVRTMRVVSARLEQDPALVRLANGAWATRMRQLVAASRRQQEVDPFPNPTVDTLREELSFVGDSVALELGSMLTESTSVRDFLSVTAGRVLAHLANQRTELQSSVTDVDDLDEILADLAALAGLWQESTVRGPAWSIGDTGRRLERCLVVLDLIEAIVGNFDGDISDAGSGDPAVEAATVEVLLAANDSLVAYRRRHRSDVELADALTLLIHDTSNPRSISATLERLDDHNADGEWAIGDAFIEDAFEALELPIDEMLPRLRELVNGVAERLVSRWFSTPVNPIEMGVLHPSVRRSER